MSTPSLTMLTATSQRSAERVKACSFSAARASVCSTTVGGRPVMARSALATARACSPSAATTSPPASRWPPARTCSRRSCAAARMRGRPSAQLERDRRAVAPARLARGHGIGERGLDELLAAAPLQHAVVGDEGDRAADAVAHRVGIAVGDVGRGDPVVVAHARDRALIRAEGRAREQQPARGRPERVREALAPREFFAEMVGLVGDDERRAAALARPPLGHARHSRVGDRHAAEVARRAQLRRVGHEMDPHPRGGTRPLARERRGRADDGDAPDGAALQLLARVLQRRARLARARRGRDQERPLRP